MDYKDQLKNPKWQKKRLEIMGRDNFQCQCCYDKEKMLTVHHKKYINSLKAWEYSNDMLITLCNTCHYNIHKAQDEDKSLFIGHLKVYLTYTDYFLLNEAISTLFKELGYKLGYKTLIQMILSQIITKDQI